LLLKESPLRSLRPQRCNLVVVVVVVVVLCFKKKALCVLCALCGEEFLSGERRK